MRGAHLQLHPRKEDVNQELHADLLVGRKSQARTLRYYSPQKPPTKAQTYKNGTLLSKGAGRIDYREEWELCKTGEPTIWRFFENNRA